jgi:hypothetical protein
LVGLLSQPVLRWPLLLVAVIFHRRPLAEPRRGGDHIRSSGDALVLFALTQFRQRSAGRMHWAPKLLTGFFIGLVFLNAGLLYIATNGLPGPVARWWLGSDGNAVYSGFSGVVAHGQSRPRRRPSFPRRTVSR